MNFHEAQHNVNRLVSKLKNEFDYSNYLVYIHPDATEEGIMLSLSDSHAPESYKDYLLEIGDELYDCLSFLNTSTAGEKNKLNHWSIDKLKPFNDSFQKIETDLIYTPHQEEWDEKVVSKIPLFEKVKKEAQISIVANLKSLLTDERKLEFPKIKWNADQKQLAELFGQLIEKKWIENPTNTTGVTAFCSVLNAVFEFNDEKSKGGSSNKTGNLVRYFKNSKGSKRSFDCVTSDGTFSEIKPC